MVSLLYDPKLSLGVASYGSVNVWNIKDYGQQSNLIFAD